MNKTSIAAVLCLSLMAVGSSAHAATRPFAKLLGAAPALPSLAAAQPIGLHVAGINVLGKQGSGLLAGLGVAGGQGVGHGIVGAGVLSGANSGRGLLGVGALSGLGSGQGAVSVGVMNAGQTPLHIGVLGKNVIGH
jgi:hypothetical protein